MILSKTFFTACRKRSDYIDLDVDVGEKSFVAHNVAMSFSVVNNANDIWTGRSLLISSSGS